MTYNFECEVCNGERYKVVASSWDDDVPMRVECDECRVNDILLNRMSYEMSMLLTKASIQRLSSVLSAAFVGRNCNDMEVLNRVQDLMVSKDHNAILDLMGVYLG